jgi:hypothetical protein
MPSYGLRDQNNDRSIQGYSRVKLHGAGLPARLLLAAVLVAIGTVVNAAPADDSFRIGFSVPAGQGVVTLRAVTNRPTTLFGSHWSGSLYVRNVETHKEYRIIDRAPVYFFESLYMGPLPPGGYELIKFESTQGSSMFNLTTKVAVDPNPGVFHVASARVTDLGTAAFVWSFQTGKFAMGYEPGALTLPRVRELMDPALTQAVQGEPLSWDPPGAGVRRPRLDEHARQVTLDLLHGSHTPTGILLFGESFGQVGMRSPSGSWGLQQTPAIDLITSVAWAKDGAIAASSEEGGVWLRSGAASSAWQAHWLPRADVAVHYVAFDSTNRLLAVAETRSAMIVYALTASSDSWDELHTFVLGGSFGVGVPRFSDASLDGDTLRITTRRTGAFKMESTVDTLSLADRSVHSNTINSLGMIGAGPGGMLYSMSGPNPAQSLLVSMDGSNWEKRGSPDWTRVVRFRTSEKGYVLRPDHALVGTGPEKTSLWITADGGRTWTRTREAPDNSVDVILLEDPSSLLIATRDGRVLRSKDDGNTWQLEFQVP